MSVAQTLSPARKLVAVNTAHFPNESAAYRTARNALLVEEIKLRRHIEDVAAKRRVLPDGGEVPHDFEVVSETGPARLSSQRAADNPSLDDDIRANAAALE